MKPLPKQVLDRLIRRALKEDASRRDVTTRVLIPRNMKARAFLIAKQSCVLCGMPVFVRTLQLQDPAIRVKVMFKEGVRIKRGARVALIGGPAHGILAGERTALNFLQRLSGIATLTRAFVNQTKGTRCKILDTRKTTPGLRLLERYAVRTGGGANHRFDLSEAIMVKDNHQALLPLGVILEKIKKRPRPKKSIVEVETLSQLKAVLAAKVSHVQLDNMPLKSLRKAVRLAAGRAKLEATGGIHLENVAAVAKTGVDFISSGALTHSAPAVDFSLEMQ